MIPELKFYVTLRSGEVIEASEEEVNTQYINLSKILCKEAFDYYFFNLRYSREDFKSLSVGSKCFIKSYHKWYTKEQRSKIHGNKISMSQRKNNSNLKSKGKPKKQLDSDKLKLYMKQRKSLEEMGRLFGVAPQTVLANLNRIGENYRRMSLRTGTLIALTEIDNFCKTSLVEVLDKEMDECVTEIDLERIRKDIQRAELYCSSLIEQLAGIRHRYKLGGSSATRNRYERYVLEYLTDEDIDYIPQYYVESYAYDVYLPRYKVLIECDGSGHHSASDKAKEILAEKNNLTLIRLDFRNLKTRKKCKNLVQSELSKKLMRLKSGTLK